MVQSTQPTISQMRTCLCRPLALAGRAMRLELRRGIGGRAARWRRRQRRGSTVALLVIGMLVLLGLAALAIDLALLRWREEQMQTGCTAAALAGAAELFDPNLLCSTPLKSLAPTMTQAQTEAVSVAAMNQVGGQSMVVNPSQGDIQFQWVANPTQYGSPPSSSDYVNSMVVRCRRTAANSNPITLVFAKSLGLTNANLTVSARATLDQRIWGFRPVLLPSGNQSNVPMVPVTIDPTDWASGACATPISGTNDQYTLNMYTGAVSSGPDGIPEVAVTVNLSNGNQAGNGLLLVFEPAGTSPQPTVNQTTIVRQTGNGLTLADLTGLDAVNNEFLMYSTGGYFYRDLVIPQIPSGYNERDTLLYAIFNAMLSIRGQRRVWPLGDDMDGSPGSRRVVNFVAAAVVNVTYVSTMDNVNMTDTVEMIVRLQPCLLETKTAITAVLPSGESRNPYLGKLLVTQ